MQNKAQQTEEATPAKESLVTETKWLRLKQVAQYLQCSRGYAYKLAQSGKIRTRKIGGLYLVNKDELEAALMKGDA